MADLQKYLLTPEEIKQAKADYGNRNMDVGYKPEHFDMGYFDKIIAQAQLTKLFSAVKDEELEKRVAEILEQPCDTCELNDNCDCRVSGTVCPYQEKKAGQILSLVALKYKGYVILEEDEQDWAGARHHPEIK